MRITLAGVLIAILAILHPVPALAVFSGDMSPRARSGDSDYADGMEAWDKEDWPKVIEAMKKVVARRPHHDNAWSRLGYAYRKTGDYTSSLDAYNKALARNPHNRAALEYLGEAYVDLGRMDDAMEMLRRLAVECKRVALTFSDGYFTDGCEEFTDLKEAIEAKGVKVGE
jgi:cytochrome c-type biogenesis protein CcmH/NrfG